MMESIRSWLLAKFGVDTGAQNRQTVDVNLTIYQGEQDVKRQRSALDLHDSVIEELRKIADRPVMPAGGRLVEDSIFGDRRRQR
jgi:hypothetical protein